MNRIIAIILLIVGIALIYTGTQRKNSIAGATESAGKEIASKVDGEARFPTHTVYMVGGAVIAIVGLAMMFRRRTV
jgi:uncharacterized protein (UPF0333 family)